MSRSGSGARPIADDPAGAIAPAEAERLFASFARLPALALAVSGGPDSTALLWLAARWRRALGRGPDLIAVTVDHGLRRGSGAEARAVKSLAASLGVAHRTLRWTGDKPTTGIPAAARDARYRLHARAAVAAGARHVLTAHTQDDQAETVLMRLSRGSGLAGLAAMANVSALPQSGTDAILLCRPLLGIGKARLVATLAAADVAFADDPTNRDAAFARPRWRALAAALAQEGLDAPALARLATRLGRANAALDAVAAIALREIAAHDGATGATRIDAARFAVLPDEIALRLLGRAVGAAGSEGPVELGKLESLFAALREAQATQVAPRFRRTLAGATVTAAGGAIRVATAPARRSRPE